ncbi:MAG: IPT/TIG domain-containing protein, partial [Candidatus Methanoperedens sp.]|nr:IPT/TIG domain-containing protein [Candidatus Methanoperedens sp.]
YINGTLVQTNTGVTNAGYTNTSAGLGVWNITATATNTNGVDSQMWIWNVTTAPTPPTSSLPPPVPQNLGLYDAGIDQLQTNATSQSACRQCHQTSGTNISGGYSNTVVGGVPTRHHRLLQTQKINPLTNALFGCGDCHPSTPGAGNGILLDRSCVDCHNGTSFWADSTLGAHVGNFSRPHHVDTANDTANIGTPAANRTCNFCHGSFVNNYNDGHYKPSYATDFMITPFATFKATNFSQPDGLGGNKVWGGCLSCHDPNPAATPSPIGSNRDNHHKEILGFSGFGGKTAFQNASTPGASCSWCHVITPGGASPLRVNITNPFTGELLVGAMEVRNSTIEATDVFEPGTTNITVNGTGCEKCHGVQSIHNIQFNYAPGGQQGLGHINNNTDCYGCHNSWLPADTWTPGALVPYVDSVSPSVIAEGTAATLTITGSNFVNGAYTSVVTVDGVTYTPTSVTDSQIVVNIPALSAGVHTVQLVKGGDTLSKLSTLTVVPAVTLSSATLNGGTLTISGIGLGNQPTTNAQQYVTFSHAGIINYSTSIISWSDTQIVATLSGSVVAGDTVEVMTANSGQATAAIVIPG